MEREEIIRKITEKKEFSDLPMQDVERAFSHFEKRQCSDEEKVKLTRDLLRKVFSAFTSRKLLLFREKDEEFVLRKHKSTYERFEHYGEIYSRIFSGINEKKVRVIDLGAGVNGFSYKYFNSQKYDIEYLAVESIGQLVKIMNLYFDKNNFKAKAMHFSLFDIERVKKEISRMKRPRIIFLMKTIDSLEMLERNYSKKLLREIAPLCDRIVASFATRSLGKRQKFIAGRYWIVNFIRENFRIIDDFELNGERYIVFSFK